MHLQESVGSQWEDIDTCKRLRGALINAIRRLKTLGHADLAKTWESRVKKMPRSRMNKEAINYILMAANFDLEKHRITD